MITKERLEELIEEGATIYVVNNKVVFEEKLNKHYTHDVLKDCVCWWSIPRKRWFFKDCFETKEDAEEYAEFGNIITIKKLTLPSWKQVQDGFYYNGSVPIYEDDSNLCFISTSKDIVLKNYESLENQTKFKKPLTRENYNEARRLCVKLFKGEKI